MQICSVIMTINDLNANKAFLKIKYPCFFCVFLDMVEEQVSLPSETELNYSTSTVFYSLFRCFSS